VATSWRLYCAGRGAEHRERCTGHAPHSRCRRDERVTAARLGDHEGVERFRDTTTPRGREGTAVAGAPRVRSAEGDWPRDMDGWLMQPFAHNCTEVDRDPARDRQCLEH